MQTRSLTDRFLKKIRESITAAAAAAGLSTITL